MQICRRTRRQALPFLAVSLVGTFGGCGAKPREPLPVIATLPTFVLEDHGGAAFTEERLRGRTTVVSFVFTRCQTICPLITERTKTLREALSRKQTDSQSIQLLAISVDPDHDRPEILRAFRQKWGLNPGAGDRESIPWIHLTGDSTAVQNLVADGFRTAVGTPVESQDGTFDILHSSHFVLVDKKARIRGYFRSDKEGTEQLVEAIDQLAQPTPEVISI